MNEENEYWERLGVTPPAEGDGEAPNNGTGDLTPTAGTEGGEGNENPSTHHDGQPPESPLKGGHGAEGDEVSGKGSGAPSSTAGTEGASNGTGDPSPTQEETEAQRMQEMEERIRAELKQSHDAQLREVLSALGLKDKDGKPVDTLEKYREVQQQAQAERLERDLKAGKLTPEGLQSALANLPGVRETVEAAQRVQQAASQQSFIAQREVQLAEIRKMNPNIKSINDIVNMPTGQAFLRSVNGGCDYVTAYKVANHDDIVKQARAAGEQAARNAAVSKGHLHQTTHNVKGGVEVTQGLREQYRRLCPDITDEEIARVEASLKKPK